MAQQFHQRARNADAARQRAVFAAHVVIVASVQLRASDRHRAVTGVADLIVKVIVGETQIATVRWCVPLMAMQRASLGGSAVTKARASAVIPGRAADRSAANADLEQVRAGAQPVRWQELVNAGERC